MHSGVLIDDQGRAWPDNSWALARRVGFRDPLSDLVSFGVRQMGFAHVREQGDTARVTLRQGRFSLVTFTGLMLKLRQMGPERIALAVEGDPFPGFRLFADLHDFCTAVEPLAAGKPLEIRLPRLAEKRNPKVLQLPAFERVRPIIELWKTTRGELTEDAYQAIVKSELFDRTVLVRKIGSYSLVTEHRGNGIKVLTPREAVQTVGRDFAELPDKEYGAWVADAYLGALRCDCPQIESIRAVIDPMSEAKFRTRYDRVLLPWKRRGELLAMGLSVQREAPKPA